IGSGAPGASRGALPLKKSAGISGQTTPGKGGLLSQTFAVLLFWGPKMGTPIFRNNPPPPGASGRTWARGCCAGTPCAVPPCCVVFEPCESVAHNRARRNSDAGLAIVAQRPRMKREHRIAIYICRNCLLRRRLALHQLLVIVEDRFYELVDELVRQILMGDRKV